MDSSSAGPLYRGMEKAALDAVYNNAVAVKNSPAIVEDWTRKTEAIRSRRSALTGIVEEIHQALDFLARKFTSNALHVSGWAAGGHLTAMAMGHRAAVRGLRPPPRPARAQPRRPQPLTILDELSSPNGALTKLLLTLI